MEQLIQIGRVVRYHRIEENAHERYGFVTERTAMAATFRDMSIYYTNVIDDAQDMAVGHLLQRCPRIRFANPLSITHTALPRHYRRNFCSSCADSDA